MIIFQQNVLDYFDDLIHILFKEEYFGFVESSEDYVNRIVDFMHQNIGVFPSKKTPNTLLRYGENYIFYKINPRTTWYIFFQKSDNNYLVTQVINNHCQEAKYL